MTPREHPLISIWTEPAPTILQLCATNPGRLYFPLAAVWGASYNMSLVLRRGFPAERLEKAEISSAWLIVGINVLFGAVSGIVVLWALSFLFARLGRVLGGRGSARDVRTVLAWSSVPHLPNLLVAILVAGIGGLHLFTAADAAGSPISAEPLRIAFFLSSFAFGIWAFVIGVAGLAAVMGFSPLRAIGVYLLGCLLILVLLFASLSAFMKLARG